MVIDIPEVLADPPTFANAKEAAGYAEAKGTMERLQAKSDRGERLTAQEHSEWWQANSFVILHKIDRALDRQDLLGAFFVTLWEIVVASRARKAFADDIDDRVAALEAQRKPRVRVKAGKPDE